MGKRLQSCFDEADKLGGLVTRMRLASMAQLTSTEANTLEDTPELVSRVQKALDTLRAEQSAQGKAGTSLREVEAAPVGEDEARSLRRHLATYLDLMAQRSLFLGDSQKTIRRVNQAASTTLAVQRVSVWLVDPAGGKITCADLYDHATREHTSGVELFARDFPPTFGRSRSNARSPRTTP